MRFGGGSASGERARDLGLLIIRVGIGGLVLFLHGYAKISSGPDSWARLGGSVSLLGIHFLPVFWGFMAALSESLGSALLLVGLAFRPAAALLAVTMLVAAVHHLSMPPGAPNSGWSGASHALELLAVYLGLILTGPGKFILTPGWMRKR